jgi:hypothetical protein
MKEVGGAVETKVSRSERGEEKNFTLVLAGKKAKQQRRRLYAAKSLARPPFQTSLFPRLQRGLKSLPAFH